MSFQSSLQGRRLLHEIRVAPEANMPTGALFFRTTECDRRRTRTLCDTPYEVHRVPEQRQTAKAPVGEPSASTRRVW